MHSDGSVTNYRVSSESAALRPVTFICLQHAQNCRAVASGKTLNLIYDTLI